MSFEGEFSAMKLYFYPGACSLSPHIVLRESGANFDIEKVDIHAKKTASGADYTAVNPKGQVPALQLDSGETLTEGPVIVQYVADQNGAAGLAGAPGTMERYRVQEWLNFITSELHKNFGPLFRPNTPDAYKDIARETVSKCFAWVNEQLAGKQYLTGDSFTVADAYLFTVTRWTQYVGIDTAKWTNLTAYMNRVGTRPKVQEALKAEGLA
jgi:glutathione S-transferase